MRRSNNARIVARAVGVELLAVDVGRVLVPQLRAEEHELGRFVERVVGAVPEPQLRLLEQQRAVVNQLLDRRRIRRRQRDRRGAGRMGGRVHEAPCDNSPPRGNDVPNSVDRARSCCRHCSHRRRHSVGALAAAGSIHRRSPRSRRRRCSYRRGRCRRSRSWTRTIGRSAPTGCAAAGASCSSASRSCPDVCPVTMSALAQTTKLAGGSARRGCGRGSS